MSGPSEQGVGLWMAPVDPAADERSARLWAMSRDERVAAMHAGRLTFGQCMQWARRAPDEVPLLNGEWWFIAINTPEIADD